MGEVYRATDSKLGREVALKVLPPDMALDPERLARFQREARAVAALNHPHIVTIHSVEEADGIHFLTMELVEGQSLDRLIPASGLPVERIVEIASALAEALAAAHEKGIMHRDLKPANVMVTDDGRVKVLDFGLAKEHHAAHSGDATLTSANQTGAGVVMGTPAYMSPEQIAGRALDHRTDIFSLGVVLHEMATGMRPFQGTSSAELASAILRDVPASVTDVRVNLPGDLARIIRRCLEKDPRHRVQTARDIGNEFRELARQTSQAVAVPASRPGAKPDSGATRAEEGFWVAVLPFKYSGGNADLTALAEGLTEDIVTGLSRFSYLRVISRSSTSRYASEAVDVRSVGKELGARYVMEGSLRQAGTKLRLAVQLVDAVSGAHLWAENYERPFNPEEIFALQDDVVPRVVSTIADSYGVLPHSMSEALRRKGPDQLSPYEAVLRSFGYYERITPEEHAKVRNVLERAVDNAPDQADCWAMLAMLYKDEHTHGFNVRPDPLGRALAAAHRAVEAAPSNHLAHHALASALFFRREMLAFRNAAERTIALNAMDGSTTAFVGHLMAYAGDWERGCALVARARQLNPHHPGWYWFPAFFDAYRKSDYRGALDVALKINMPGYFYASAALAAAHGQLGEREAAHTALLQLLTLKPDFAAAAREELGKWFGRGEVLEHFLDGLRKAGLDVAAAAGTDQAAVAPTVPAAAAADVGTIPGFGGRPAIAVLPFDNLSGDPEQEYFADGLAEDLITRLSLWRAFPVIARNSSFVYKGKAVDVKQVSADLGVRYVVEGSVRKVGNQVRIAAQLIDAATGEHVWAKTYDRELTDIFAVQDEISEAIATPLASDLERAEHSRAQRRAPENLEAWGLFQRALPLLHRFTREDSSQARTLLERAVALDPQFSTPLARLGEVGVWEVVNSWTDSPERTLEVAVAQGRRAVALDPRDAVAQTFLAFALITAGDSAGAHEAARRAVDLNPSMPLALAFLAYLTHMIGNPPQESIDLVQRAMRLSPHDPVEWIFYDALGGAYWNAGRYEEGLAVSRRLIALSPSYYFGYIWGVLNAVGLGQIEEAKDLIRQARQVQPALSLALVRRGLGAMATDVDRRMAAALREAGVE